MQYLISPRFGRAFAAHPRKTATPLFHPASSELAKRRGEVLRGFFPKLAAWLEDSAQRAHRRDVEDYLSQAKDIADLEDRIRRLERQPTPRLI